MALTLAQRAQLLTDLYTKKMPAASAEEDHQDQAAARQHESIEAVVASLNEFIDRNQDAPGCQQFLLIVNDPDSTPEEALREGSAIRAPLEAAFNEAYESFISHSRIEFEKTEINTRLNEIVATLRARASSSSELKPNQWFTDEKLVEILNNSFDVTIEADGSISYAEADLTELESLMARLVALYQVFEENNLKINRRNQNIKATIAEIAGLPVATIAGDFITAELGKVAHDSSSWEVVPQEDGVELKFFGDDGEAELDGLQTVLRGLNALQRAIDAQVEQIKAIINTLPADYQVPGTGLSVADYLKQERHIDIASRNYFIAEPSIQINPVDLLRALENDCRLFSSWQYTQAFKAYIAAQPLLRDHEAALFRGLEVASRPQAGTLEQLMPAVEGLNKGLSQILSQLNECIKEMGDGLGFSLDALALPRYAKVLDSLYSFSILQRTADGRIVLHDAIFNCAPINPVDFFTARLKDFKDQRQAVEGSRRIIDDGVLSTRLLENNAIKKQQFLRYCSAAPDYLLELFTKQGVLVAGAENSGQVRYSQETQTQNDGARISEAAEGAIEDKLTRQVAAFNTIENSIVTVLQRFQAFDCFAFVANDQELYTTLMTRLVRAINGAEPTAAAVKAFVALGVPPTSDALLKCLYATDILHLTEGASSAEQIAHRAETVFQEFVAENAKKLRAFYINHPNVDIDKQAPLNMLRGINDQIAAIRTEQAHAEYRQDERSAKLDRVLWQLEQQRKVFVSIAAAQAVETNLPEKAALTCQVGLAAVALAKTNRTLSTLGFPALTLSTPPSCTVEAREVLSPEFEVENVTHALWHYVAELSECHVAAEDSKAVKAAKSKRLIDYQQHFFNLSFSDRFDQRDAMVKRIAVRVACEAVAIADTTPPLVAAVAQLEKTRVLIEQFNTRGFLARWWNSHEAQQILEPLERQKSALVAQFKASRNFIEKGVIAEVALRPPRQNYWRTLFGRPPLDYYSCDDFETLMSAASPLVALRALAYYNQGADTWKDPNGEARRLDLIKATIQKAFAWRTDQFDEGKELITAREEALKLFYAEKALFGSESLLASKAERHAVQAERRAFFGNLIAQLPSREALRTLADDEHKALFKDHPEEFMALLNKTLARSCSFADEPTAVEFKKVKTWFKKYPGQLLDLLTNPAVSPAVLNNLIHYLVQQNKKLTGKYFNTSILTELRKQCAASPKYWLLAVTAPTLMSPMTAVPRNFGFATLPQAELTEWARAAVINPQVLRRLAEGNALANQVLKQVLAQLPVDELLQLQNIMQAFAAVAPTQRDADELGGFGSLSTAIDETIQAHRVAQHAAALAIVAKQHEIDVDTEEFQQQNAQLVAAAMAQQCVLAGGMVAAHLASAVGARLLPNQQARVQTTHGSNTLGLQRSSEQLEHTKRTEKAALLVKALHSTTYAHEDLLGFIVEYAQLIAQHGGANGTFNLDKLDVLEAPIARLIELQFDYYQSLRETFLTNPHLSREAASKLLTLLDNAKIKAQRTRSEATFAQFKTKLVQLSVQDSEILDSWIKAEMQNYICADSKFYVELLHYIASDVLHPEVRTRLQANLAEVADSVQRSHAGRQNALVAVSWEQSFAAKINNIIGQPVPVNEKQEELVELFGYDAAAQGYAQNLWQVLNCREDFSANKLAALLLEQPTPVEQAVQVVQTAIAAEGAEVQHLLNVLLTQHPRLVVEFSRMLSCYDTVPAILARLSDAGLTFTRAFLSQWSELEKQNNERLSGRLSAYLTSVTEPVVIAANKAWLNEAVSAAALYQLEALPAAALCTALTNILRVPQDADSQFAAIDFAALYEQKVLSVAYALQSKLRNVLVVDVAYIGLGAFRAEIADLNAEYENLLRCKEQVPQAVQAVIAENAALLTTLRYTEARLIGRNIQQLLDQKLTTEAQLDTLLAQIQLYQACAVGVDLTLLNDAKEAALDLAKEFYLADRATFTQFQEVVAVLGITDPTNASMKAFRAVESINAFLARRPLLSRFNAYTADLTRERLFVAVAESLSCLRTSELYRSVSMSTPEQLAQLAISVADLDTLERALMVLGADTTTPALALCDPTKANIKAAQAILNWLREDPQWYYSTIRAIVAGLVASNGRPLDQAQFLTIMQAAGQAELNMTMDQLLALLPNPADEPVSNVVVTLMNVLQRIVGEREAGHLFSGGNNSIVTIQQACVTARAEVTTRAFVQQQAAADQDAALLDTAGKIFSQYETSLSALGRWVAAVMTPSQKQAEELVNVKDGVKQLVMRWHEEVDALHRVFPANRRDMVDAIQEINEQYQASMERLKDYVYTIELKGLEATQSTMNQSKREEKATKLARAWLNQLSAKVAPRQQVVAATTRVQDIVAQQITASAAAAGATADDMEDENAAVVAATPPLGANNGAGVAAQLTSTPGVMFPGSQNSSPLASAAASPSASMSREKRKSTVWRARLANTAAATDTTTAAATGAHDDNTAGGLPVAKLQ